MLLPWIHRPLLSLSLLRSHISFGSLVRLYTLAIEVSSPFLFFFFLVIISTQTHPCHHHFWQRFEIYPHQHSKTVTIKFLFLLINTTAAAAVVCIHITQFGGVTDTRNNTSHILKTLLLLINTATLFLFVWFGVVTHPRRGNILILILILGKDKTTRLHSILLVKTPINSFFLSFVRHLSSSCLYTPHPHASLYLCSFSSATKQIKKNGVFLFLFL